MPSVKWCEQVLLSVIMAKFGIFNSDTRDHCAMVAGVENLVFSVLVCAMALPLQSLVGFELLGSVVAAEGQPTQAEIAQLHWVETEPGFAPISWQGF